MATPDDPGPDIIVFSGPTLAPEDVQRHLPEARSLPPTAQGDLFRAVDGWLSSRERVPTSDRTQLVVCLIDGVFDQVNAVAHKEILWAMAQGVYVYGAASMGALRAVELAPFGMRGIGCVYQWFAEGMLEDDDEVAVAHAAADMSHLQMSEAMVDIRATLAAACAAGCIDADQLEALITIGKALFYPERSYPALLAGAHDAGLERTSMVRLQHFLQTGKVAQKRRDAVQLMRHVGAERTAHQRPLTVGYDFSHTNAWQALCRRARSRPPS